MHHFNHRPAKARFDSKWIRDEGTGCWEWQASKDKDGYGGFWAGKELGKEHEIRAHRASWLIHKGKIPDDSLICHTCDNPSCVNPDHLFVGTPMDNMQDKIKKGRQPQGADYGRSPLMDCDIPKIRASVTPATDLAIIYGVTQSTILAIKHRRKWKHVP